MYFLLWLIYSIPLFFANLFSPTEVSTIVTCHFLYSQEQKITEKNQRLCILLCAQFFTDKHGTEEQYNTSTYTPTNKFHIKTGQSYNEVKVCNTIPNLLVVCQGGQCYPSYSFESWIVEMILYLKENSRRLKQLASL